MNKDAHTQRQTIPNELWDIEQLINDGMSEIAIQRLNNVPVEPEEFSEKEFLLGYANRLIRNDNVAIGHFIKANSMADQPHLPAAQEAMTMLSEYGYLREARYLLAQVTNRLDSSGSILYSDIDKLFSIVQSVDDQKIISIHQPAYIPWLGYFHKIYYSDKFVIHDAVKFIKKSFIKRTLIRKSTTSESTYLTIPAQKHSDFCLINEIKSNETIDWRTEHVRKIESAYKKAPHFKKTFPLIESIFQETRHTTSLVEITTKFTLGILAILDIKREIFHSSDLLKDKNYPTPHDTNMGMCQMLDCAIYFSGTGAKEYQDSVELPERIKLIYQNFWKYSDENPYIESPIFIKGLSILDALFYIGPTRIIEFFENYEDPANHWRTS
jgi:hypothetical protein